MPNFIRTLCFAALAFPVVAAAVGNSQKVGVDLKTYDDHVAALNSAFNPGPADLSNKVWVKAKLHYMVEVDQYTRVYMMNSLAVDTFLAAYDSALAVRSSKASTQEYLKSTNADSDPDEEYDAIQAKRFEEEETLLTQPTSRNKMKSPASVFPKLNMSETHMYSEQIIDGILKMTWVPKGRCDAEGNVLYGYDEERTANRADYIRLGIAHDIKN